MKPITYWVQNDAIDKLVEQYGSHLQKLSANDRRLFIAVLAMGNVAQTNEEFHLFLAEFEESVPISVRLDGALTLVENLLPENADRLIEAIAATLTHQRQKTGTPSH